MRKNPGQTRERLRQLRRNARGLCSFAKCDEKWVRSGYCEGHYEAVKRANRERYQRKAAAR